jgi:hypothetical protein
MRIKRSKYVIIVITGLVVFIVFVKWIKCSVDKQLLNVEVILTAKVEHDDVFQVLYWEKGEEKFKIENSVRTKVNASAVFQEIKFKLPNLTDLYKLRLDIGEDSNQQNIIIQSFKFKSAKGENEFNANEFNQMFLPNKYIKLNFEGSYTGFSGDKNQKSFYDPYFVSMVDSEQMMMIKGKESVVYSYIGGLIASIIFMLFMLKCQERILISSTGTFASIFILMLIIPTLQKKFGFVEELENIEKRKLTEKPEFTFSLKFAKNFEIYLNDNFGFRNQLVHWGANIKTKVFRSSVHPDKVMLGKNKWLYYNHFKSNIFDSYRNENLLPSDTLRLLINQWENNKKVLEAHGMKYFLAFWPNKHSIYPEYLPESMAIQIKDTISRVDQIIAYTNQTKSNIRLIDVRPNLIRGKKEFQLYHKFDTHWNDYGAFLGYQSFFSQVQDELQIVPKNSGDFNINWVINNDGDLLQMLGVRNNGFFEEKSPKFTIKENINQIEYLPIDGYPKRTIRTRNKFAGNQLKALVIRDSYANRLIQFFSLHFYEVTYIRGDKEFDFKKENPDLIIDCFVEREIAEEDTLYKL